MELYQCVGIQKVNFKVPDGNEINGFNLFVVYGADNVEGVKTERIFISDRARNNFDYFPSVDDKFNVIYNRYGKVEGFIKR